MNGGFVCESKEMYLESILILNERIDPLKAKDLAEYMGFSRASVSRALSGLEGSGLISRDGNDAISLTLEGRKVAEKVWEKHMVISDFLESIGVDRLIAQKDACKFEHVISEETFDKIKEFVAGNVIPQDGRPSCQSRKSI